MTKAKRKPTTEKLAEALSLAGASKWMIDNANAGYYDDYKSPIALPIYQLVQDARAEGLMDIVHRAKNCDFDAQKWEADEWAQSPEGKLAFQEAMQITSKNGGDA